jgi:hypothetical protein
VAWQIAAMQANGRCGLHHFICPGSHSKISGNNIIKRTQTNDSLVFLSYYG